MIVYQQKKLIDEIKLIHPRLLEIVLYTSTLLWELVQEPFMVTSIYRPNDGSTHANPPPYRFLDGRCPTQLDNNWLRNHLNKRYPHPGQPKYETVAPLDHGTGPHVHIQVRD